jgi:hypothetical protein
MKGLLFHNTHPLPLPSSLPAPAGIFGIFFAESYTVIRSSRGVLNQAKYMQARARRSLRDRQLSIPPPLLWGSTAVYVGPFLVRDVDIHILRILSTMYPRASMVGFSGEMTSKLPAKLVDGGRQPSAQMSIAFLVGNHSKTACTDLDTFEDCFDMAPTPANVPPVPYDQNEKTRMESNISSLQTELSQHSHRHLPIQARSVEIVNEVRSLGSSCASNSGTESYGYGASSLSSMLSTGFHKPSSGVNHTALHHHHRCHNHSAQTYKSAEAPTREPRFARPSYTEEQKFFIVFHRIVKKLSWPEVENEFARYYKLRSKNGLTSVYYRIRSSWGMGNIIKNQAHSEDDLSVIKIKADYFSRAFLENIGYFD